MTSWGYTLGSEEHGPSDLVRNAGVAEERGFDFVSISDHYHPWISEQGNSPFVWSVIGGIAATTSRLQVAVGVTCPIMRIHPAVIAQATATSAVMLDGRFVFGVGTGEALNEHITGQRWPNIETRLEMLKEAVAIIRELWTGETTDIAGTYFIVDNAKLFTAPDEPPPIIVSAFGEKAARVAAEIGDGIWSTSPSGDILSIFTEAGGSGPRYAQLSLCWAKDKDEAVKTAHRIWPNTGVKGQLSQDLPTWTHFEQASSLVTPEHIADALPCGPDPEPLLESIKEYVDAGYDHLYFHQIGPDQDGFFTFWEKEIRPRL